MADEKPTHWGSYVLGYHEHNLYMELNDNFMVFRPDF
jgi:hypothetical protein